MLLNFLVLVTSRTAVLLVRDDSAFEAVNVGNKEGRFQAVLFAVSAAVLKIYKIK